MLKYIKNYLDDVEAREARVREDDVLYGYNSGKDVMAEKDGGPKHVSHDMWPDYNWRRYSKIGRFSQAVSDRIRSVNRWTQEPMNYALSILAVAFLMFLIYMVNAINSQPDGWTMVWRSLAGIDLQTP